MKIPYVPGETIKVIKSGLPNYLSCFNESSSESLQKELGIDLLKESGLKEIEDLELDQSEDAPNLTDFENVKRVYNTLGFLSKSQATDERLWAGLCLGPFWNYVKYRWNITEGSKKEKILDHYFFSKNIRRSLMRNALSRLWWIGHFTYDEKSSDPWELTRFICRHSDFILNALERNFSNNPNIIKPFLRALLDVDKTVSTVNTDVFQETAKYLNILGGIYLLDYLPEKTIYTKTYQKAVELCFGQTS